MEAVRQVYPIEASEPAGLLSSVKLKPYQRQSLAFMLQVERSQEADLLGERGQRGGWLTDEVGMGKTMVTISLILANPAPAAADAAAASCKPEPGSSSASGCNSGKGILCLDGNLKD